MDKFAFNEALIAEMSRHSCIWEVGSHDYKIGWKRDLAWKTVAAALGVDVSTVQKRWKTLRDTFVKKRKEALPPPSGSSPNKVVYVRWPHYEQMQFLEDSLQYPETSGNLHKSKSKTKSPPRAHQQEDASQGRLSDAESLLHGLYGEVTPEKSPSTPPMPIAGPSTSLQRPNTSRGKQCKRRLEKPFEKEINLLGQMACKETDASEHFGMLLADKHRQCSPDFRCEMEIEMLQVAAKYLNMK